MFEELWPIVWRYGAGIGIAGGALAWAYFMPVFKKTALWVALGAILITGTFGIGVHLGEQRGRAKVKADWDAALAQEAENGRKAREDAERAIARDTPDSVRNDPSNRDLWPSPGK